MKTKTSLLTFAAIALLGWHNPVLAADSEPGTTAIVAVVPDLNHIQKWNDMGGDTADPFWADDDNLYHFSCDGRGFGKNLRAVRNLCFNKLTGPDLQDRKSTRLNSSH